MTTLTHPLAQSRSIHEWAAKNHLSTAQLAVLATLANYRNEQGIVWPSVATIARQACCCVRTAQAALKVLLRKGLIKVTKPATSHDATVYQVFLPPTPAGDAPLTCAQTRISCAAGAQTPHPKEQEKEIKNAHTRKAAKPTVRETTPAQGTVLPRPDPPSQEDQARMAAVLRAWRLDGMKGDWRSYA